MSRAARNHPPAPDVRGQAILRGHLETARSLAAGIISGGVIHEFANLLTIVDGQLQLESLGLVAGASAGEVGRLLAEPAGRGLQLVEAFRHVFSDLDPGPQEAPLTHELASLRVLLAVRLRGRPTHVEIGSGDSPLLLPGPSSPAMRLAFLLGLLSILEHGRAGDHYPERILLDGTGTGSTCRALIAEVTRFIRAPEDHQGRVMAEHLRQAAGELIASFGGRLILEDGEHGTVHLRIDSSS